MPILLLLRILENVSLFLSEIRIALASKKLTLKEAKIIPRRLRKAEQLWWKIHDTHRCKPSRLSDEDQVKGLTDILVDTFPEQVAVLASDGKWYSGGCRVRWQELKSMVDAQEIFLFNPTVDFGRKSDLSQKVLKPQFCMPLLRSVGSQTRVIVVSDSSLNHDAFVYGIARKLASMDMLLLWSVVQCSAKGEDLRVAWDKAPVCDIGLTIWNCNDGDGVDCSVVENVVVGSRVKCTVQSIFFVNHASFFPHHLPGKYPNIVERTQNLLRGHGVLVFDGFDYLGRQTLDDSIHFSIACTEMVTEMYCEAISQAYGVSSHNAQTDFEERNFSDTLSVQAKFEDSSVADEPIVGEMDVDFGAVDLHA